MEFGKRDGKRAYWRVFYTSARAEKACEVRLTRRKINVFLPKVATVRRWKNGVRKTIESPLFPNYIFARVDEWERIGVLETPGIVRSISFNGKLAEVSDEVIERLKVTQRDPTRISRHAGPLTEPGRYVEIESGPFRGLKGEVLGYRSNWYVVVRIDAIHQCVRVQIPAELVVPMAD